MKKTIKTMLAFVAGALCLAGCEQENTIEEVSNARLVTLTAYQEGNGATRAAIDGTTSTQINWSTDDQINYFGSAGQSMTLQSGAGTASGTFSGTVTTGTTDYVLYPYQVSATCSTEGVITAEVPMTQYAVEGSFDPAAALMVATVDGTSAQFKNVMSYVKVTIPSDMTNCKQVAIKAKDAWTTVAGKVKIAAKAEAWSGASVGDWSETDAKEGEAFVRLVPKSPETILTAGTSYYIAILPQTMTTGFELIFNDNDVIKVKLSASSSVVFGRSKTKKLATFSNEDASFTYKVSAVELASGLKVADRNIGAASSSAYGDYFAWAALRPAYITKTLSYKAGGFTADNTPYYNGSAYTKYTTTDGKTVLDKEDDIAAMLWGGKWRMPTKEELSTLSGLKETWTSGWSFKGKDSYSSNSVFLPAAGQFNSSIVMNGGIRGSYRSSAPVNSNRARFLSFFSSDARVSGTDERYPGCSVRAVLAE